jgi:hypothetical protein
MQLKRVMALNQLVIALSKPFSWVCFPVDMPAPALVAGYPYVVHVQHYMQRKCSYITSILPFTPCDILSVWTRLRPVPSTPEPRHTVGK